MNIYDIPIATLEGKPSSLDSLRGKVVLAVNVASKCGFTPQYDGLQRIYERYKDRAFAVIGFPCNQFLGQEPGAPEEIEEFCRMTYGVTFPIFEKIEVNGENEHPIFTELKEAADDDGNAGDVNWNFEKFLIAPDGTVVKRFRTQVKPEDAQITDAIEDLLARDRLSEQVSEPSA